MDPEEKKIKTTLKLSPVTNLFPKDLKSTSTFFQKLCFLLKVVVGKVEDEHIFVSPVIVTCVACYQILPPNTFQISRSAIIIRQYDYEPNLSIDSPPQPSISLFFHFIFFHFHFLFHFFPFFSSNSTFFLPN